MKNSLLLFVAFMFFSPVFLNAQVSDGMPFSVPICNEYTYVVYIGADRNLDDLKGYQIVKLCGGKLRGFEHLTHHFDDTDFKCKTDVLLGISEVGGPGLYRFVVSEQSEDISSYFPSVVCGEVVSDQIGDSLLDYWRYFTLDYTRSHVWGVLLIIVLLLVSYFIRKQVLRKRFYIR